MEAFLEASRYLDFHNAAIRQKAEALFSPAMNSVAKAKAAFAFVRDEIPHSFDCNAEHITAAASAVLTYQTGICHAKANLLAALLRGQGIPTGFCFQHITLGPDDSQGYCLHCFNAAWLAGKWVKLDARGNTNGINAQFSLATPSLAFANRPQYDEYFYNGIFAVPDTKTMELLEQAENLQQVAAGLPDRLSIQPLVRE